MVRHGARQRRRAGRSGRCATSCRWCASTSACPPREGGAPRPHPAGGRSPPPAAAAQRLPSPARYDVAAGRLGARAGRRPARGRRTARGAPRPRRARADLRARLLQEQGASAAGRCRSSPRRRRPGERTTELSQTVVDDRSGRVLESWTGLQGRVDDGARLRRGVRPGRQRAVDLAAAVRAVRAAVRAPAAAAAAPRPGRAARVLGLLRVLQRVADRRLGPARLSAARLPARAHARDRVLACARARAAAAAADAPGERARDRRRLPARRPLRAQRRRLERDRRRLRERDRRRPLRLGRGGVRQLPARQPARRHLRAGPLLRLRAVRGAAAVARRLGRPAGRARRGGRVRPADRRRAVAARAAPARARARRAARLRVGGVPVHAAGGELERQRRPGRAARDRGDARRWRSRSRAAR